MAHKGSIQFQRTYIQYNSMTRSVCSLCSDMVAYSPNLDALAIAEKAHNCSGLSRALRLRVFVVDDNASVADTISLILRREGFEVFTFHAAVAAAQKAISLLPDVVVADYAMPDIDGLTLTAWLRENCPACKVVILSGNTAAVAERAVVGLRFTLLQKPVAPDVLVAAVE